MKNILIFDKNKERHQTLRQHFARLDDVRVYQLIYDGKSFDILLSSDFSDTSKLDTDQICFDAFLIHGTDAASMGLPEKIHTKKRVWFSGGSQGKFDNKEGEDEIIYRPMPHPESVLSSNECEQLLEYIDENISKRPVFLEPTGRRPEKEAIVKIVDLFMGLARSKSKFDLDTYADQITTLCTYKRKKHKCSDECLEQGQQYLDQIYASRPNASDVEGDQLRIFYQKIATIRDQLFEQYIDNPKND